MTGAVVLAGLALASAILVLPSSAALSRIEGLQRSSVRARRPGDSSVVGGPPPGVFGRRPAGGPSAVAARADGLGLGWRRPGGAVVEQSETEALLAFLDVLAPSLRAGRSPEEAARLACEVVDGGAVVADMRDALGRGRSVEAVLSRHARDHPDVRLFARAWQLSALTGCPLADTVACVARLVRAKLAHRRRVETASTGAGATIRILTALPLGGPLLAFAVGVDPMQAYVRSPIAWWCLVAGGVLVLAGRIWVRRLVEQVARGPVLG